MAVMLKQLSTSACISPLLVVMQGSSNKSYPLIYSSVHGIQDGANFKTLQYYIHTVLVSTLLAGKKFHDVFSNVSSIHSQ